MSAPAYNWNAEQRIQRHRLAKARRFVSRFLHQMRAAGVANPETDKAALEEALAIVRAASQEQWVKLAKEMGEKEPPSGATVLLIISDLEAKIADVDKAKKQAQEDAELIAELYRQRGTGSIGAEVLVTEDSR